MPPVIAIFYLLQENFCVLKEDLEFYKFENEQLTECLKKNCSTFDQIVKNNDMLNGHFVKQPFPEILN